MADSKLTALTAAGQLAGTDELYVVQGIGTTPVSRRTTVSTVRTYANIKDAGADPTGVADSTAAINAAIAAVPTVVGDAKGGVVFFPGGSYKITSPINLTKQAHLMGEGYRASEIRMADSPGFTGYFGIRNWTDTESATATPPTAEGPHRQLYANIEQLGITMGDTAGMTAICLAGFQEGAFIRNVRLTSGVAGTRGIRICPTSDFVVGEMELTNIVCYGSFGSELYVDCSVTQGIGIGVSKWTSDSNVHSESIFYFKNIHNVTLTNMHAEGYAADAATTDAIYKIVDVMGFALTNSLIMPSEGTARPLLRAENSDGQGYARSAPVLENIRIIFPGNFSANLIEDGSQQDVAPHVITAAACPARWIDRYDGGVLRFRAGDNMVPTEWQLHAGIENYVGWGTAAPTSGTWKVGDKVWNTTPTSGGVMGWVCTTAGTYGTWKAFGAVA